MRERVLDASVVFEWFSGNRRSRAYRLRGEFEAGELIVLAPTLLLLEIVNVAGRRWGWDGAALADLASALDDLPFELVEPEIASVAEWVARGLTAYDAAYLAVADAARVEVLTLDEKVLRAAPEIARRPGPA